MRIYAMGSDFAEISISDDTIMVSDQTNQYASTFYAGAYARPFISEEAKTATLKDSRIFKFQRTVGFVRF